MRSSNPFNKIKELQGAPIVLVKICGIQDVPMAIATAEAGRCCASYNLTFLKEQTLLA